MASTGISIALLIVVLAVASAAVPAQRFPSNQEVPTIKGVLEALRFAFVGSPTYHAKQPWDFDPEVSKRRNPGYEALHGHHSERLIERLGLGEDGREEERRQQQAIRDIGVPITGKR
ncbi:uncharacterized protein LOC129005188 [Macrosteles quadrilineatus]|uniref:uncharacterized protein LOC128996961 n=1 Tax=Macrosteles quadrilineatus TaxID=74068 RepID=UPI0023E2080D|nr:uncharacterized protein LOC128996961 [Macrosteles quadrilineatus]XP_054289994.1 uncharacterized protein LOC129005188 [Macrosteles quadrilineatus]